MQFFKGLMCSVCLALWFVLLVINGHLAGWKGVGVYWIGTIFYVGFCLLMEVED